MSLLRGSNDDLSRLVINASAMLFGARVLKSIVSVAGVAVLARLLTPSDFGVVAVASMILPLSLVILEGLIDVPTIREDTLDRDGLANLVWIGVAIMAVLCVVLWLAAPRLAILLNSPRLAEVLPVLSIGLLLQPYLVAGQALLRRLHLFAASALFIPLSGVAYVLSALSLALMGFGMWSLIWGQLLSLLLVAFGVTWISGIPIQPPRRLRTADAWRFGGIGMASKLPAWLAANVDTLFASAALGSSGAGIYTRAYNLTTQVKEPFAVLDQTIRQAFVAQRNLDNATASRATLCGLRLVVLASSLSAAGIIVMREAVVALLLGSQWDAVVLPLAILAASLPARVARIYLDGFAFARGSMRHMVTRNVLILALLAAGLWLWAAEGVTAIALVVASVHLARLLFRGGSVDVAIAGSLMQRARAIIPGISLAFCVIVFVEAALLLITLDSDVEEVAWRALLFSCTVLVIGLYFPRDWIPRSLHPSLPRIIGFLKR